MAGTTSASTANMAAVVTGPGFRGYLRRKVAVHDGSARDHELAAQHNEDLARTHDEEAAKANPCADVSGVYEICWTRSDTETTPQLRLGARRCTIGRIRTWRIILADARPPPRTLITAADKALFEAWLTAEAPDGANWPPQG